MTIWLKQLDRREKKTMTACFGGWALDAFDVQIFSFVIPALIAAFGFSRGEAGVLGTTALLFSALGGLLGGALADKFGRVRTLKITIVWFSVFTLLCGFAQNYEQLLVLRSLQGLGFGAEWAAGAVLMSEVIRSKYRGRAAGVVHSGFAVGWGAAAILYYAVFSMVDNGTAWRLMFMAGALPAVFILFIRRNVQESDVYLETTTQLTEKRSPVATFTRIFHRDLIRNTVFASMFSIGLQGGYYAVVTWLPTYLATEKGLSVGGTTGFLAVIITGAFFGFISGGYISDRIGRKPTFMLFALLSILLVSVYMFIDVENWVLMALGLPLGFCANAMFGPTGAFYAELFPTEVRGTGQGFCYNFGRGVGALFPALVGFLSASLSLGVAIGIYTVGAYSVAIVALLGLPETRSKSIDSDALGPEHAEA
ncbi:MFS transporter [Mycolicibacterium mengxianglii]|uniref:MFS transporter n=1 Tax=Mycolicibacterium mengxianglii TaxID=2736649 RepID=UPI0018EEE53F|nr:MFS transporter [Mycolicibacterium mengxianglii]